MCATHNVGRSSMVVIQQELEKGAQVTDEIMIGRRSWKDLFTKHTFFTSGFRYYLTVIAASRTKKAQNAWSGFVESRVRVLVNKLEMHQSIALARPFNKGYDRVHRCKNNTEVEEVVSAGSLAYLYKPPADGEEGVKSEAKTEPKQEIKSENGVPSKQENAGVKGEDGIPIKQEHSDEAPAPPATNIKPEPADHAEANLKLEDIPEKKDEPEYMEIYTTNHYIGLQLVEGAKSLDLSREVNDWKAMCTSNDLFEEGLMFLSIQHVKNTALPDDVFEPGETKPRPVKKSLKRVASEEPGNKQQPPAKRQVQGKAPVPAQQQRQQQQQPATTAAAAAG
jgi:poly(A) polymerase